MFNFFEKFVIWVAGRIGGVRSQRQAEASPLLPLFGQAILNGSLNALSTTAHLDAAEQAAVTEALEGVPVASDPSTYTSGLIDAIGTIPAGKISPTAILLTELAVETASATYVAAHPNPVSLLAPAIAAAAPQAVMPPSVKPTPAATGTIEGPEGGSRAPLGQLGE